jgi:hypothetical protein
MKNFKQACFGAATMAVVAMGAIVASGDSAQALSINFSPSGTNPTVENPTDPIPDIITSPGSTLSFNILLETFGIASNETVDSVTYDFGFDPSELSFASYVPPLGVTNTSVASPLGGYSRQITRSGLGAVANQGNILLGTINFNVLPGLNNDSQRDFFISFASAFAPGSMTPFPGVTFGQTQQVEVQAAAVPTPALLPGLLGLGAAAWRKRKSQEAAVQA